MYNGEASMALARMSYLNDIVDFFIITESNSTFSGLTKDYIFNIDMFHKFRNKIIYIKHQSNENFLFNFKNRNSWIREKNQRNFFIKSGNIKFNDDDIILLGDIDEIPNLTLLKIILKSNLISPYTLLMSFHYYNLDCLILEPWYGTIVTSYKNFFVNTPEKLRRNRSLNNIIINGGWHLSYFMNPSEISNKIRSFSHQEFNNTKFNDAEKIEQRITNNLDLFNRNIKFIKIDSSFYTKEFNNVFKLYF